MPNLNPITRKEAILNGDDVTPVTREEYFAKNAVSGSGSGGGGEVFSISQGLTTALLACVQTAVGAAVSGSDNVAHGSDSGQQLSSESDTETAFAAAKAFSDGGSVRLSFPGIGVKLSPITGYWSDSEAGHELAASIGGVIPAYNIPMVGTGFVQWNLNVACQLDGDNNRTYGYDIYVAVSLDKVAGNV